MKINIKIYQYYYSTLVQYGSGIILNTILKLLQCTGIINK